MGNLGHKVQKAVLMTWPNINWGVIPLKDKVQFQANAGIQKK